jgi:hypothetical protein
VGRVPIPKPSFLDSCDYLGFVHGERRWRSKSGKRIYTWDALHGQIEVFDQRGNHVGVLDAATGQPIGGAVRGRYINV